MQTTLSFFQNLLLEWYQFTLENELYAICLAVSVWLLTAIFYSLRIGFLNRRNRLNFAALTAAQKSLEAAQQQIKQLQEEIAANSLQLEQAKDAAEQDTKRIAALQERIALLNKQLIEGIQTLVAHIEPGGHFLPAIDNLETEGLWQHLSAGMKQLIERLRIEQQTKAELQQAYRTETAKLAEKDLELGTLQARLNTQAQQVAQYELIIEEHKTQLKQQENAEQRLSETLQKHQADLARLALLEQQALDWANTQRMQAPREAQLKPQEALSAQPEQAAPVETLQIQPQPAIIEEKPQPVQREMEQIEVAESFTQDVPEELKEQPVKAVKKSSGDAAGKFKHFFAGAKQQIEKLDEKFTGRNNSGKAPELQLEAEQIKEEPEAVMTSISSPSGPSSESLPINTAKAQASIGGKLKKLFAGAKGASSSEKPVLTETPIPATSTEADQSIQASSGEQVEPSANTSEKKPTQLKNLFGKFKRN